MDVIYLKGLRAETIIGVYEWERRTRQTIVIDIEMVTDIRKAAASDSLEDTLNYKSIAKRLLAYIEQSQFQLVETLAERLATILLEEFHITWLRLCLNKPGAVRYVRDVGVIIERGHRET